MRLETLRELYPVGSPVRFTISALSIAGGWTVLKPDDIGVVIGYVPAGSSMGCRLVVDWGNERVIPVFSSQVEIL